MKKIFGLIIGLLFVASLAQAAQINLLTQTDTFGASWTNQNTMNTELYVGLADLETWKATLDTEGELKSLYNLEDADIEAIIAAYTLGVFTGTTITDDQTTKQALQALETALEGVAGGHLQNTDTGLGTLATKNPPIDADKVVYRDSTNSDALVTSSWTQIKAFLKTYFDTLYSTFDPDEPGIIGSTAPAAATFTKVTIPATSSGGQYGTWQEDIDNGENVVGLCVYGNIDTDYLLALPLTVPAPGQILVFTVPFDQTMSDGSTKSVAVGSWVSAITLPPVILAEPDQMQTIDDAWPLYQFIAEDFPSGFTITSIHISTSETCTDVLNFEEWSNNGTAWSTTGSVEAITLSGTHTEDDGTLVDTSIAANSWLYVDLPAAPSDIAYYSITISGYPN